MGFNSGFKGLKIVNCLTSGENWAYYVLVSVNRCRWRNSRFWFPFKSNYNCISFIIIFASCASVVCLFFWPESPQWARAFSFTRCLDHTQRRTTVCRTPLDERSACRRNLYLTAHNICNRQTSIPLVEFENTISAGERPQNYALDRAAIAIGISRLI